MLPQKKWRKCVFSCVDKVLLLHPQAKITKTEIKSQENDWILFHFIKRLAIQFYMHSFCFSVPCHFLTNKQTNSTISLTLSPAALSIFFLCISLAFILHSNAQCLNFNSADKCFFFLSFISIFFFFTILFCVKTYSIKYVNALNRKENIKSIFQKKRERKSLSNRGIEKKRTKSKCFVFCSNKWSCNV